MKISYSKIKAALAVIPKHDIRYYLMGACLDVRETDITLVATDGHVLIAIPCPPDPDDTRPPVGQWVIPVDLLRAIKPVSTKAEEIDVVITPAAARATFPHAGHVSMCGKTMVSGPLHDAVYPDWRKVMPTSADGRAAHFGPVYVGMLSRAFAALGASDGSDDKSTIIIHYNGPESALVTAACTDALGVIMPRRCTGGELTFPESLPEWAR